MIAEINGKIVDTDFETIYKHSKGLMLTTIEKYVRLKPGDEYDDIIQLMAIDLFKAFSKGFDPAKSSFKSYVITICRRRAFLYNRKNNQLKFEKKLEKIRSKETILDKILISTESTEEVINVFGEKLTDLDKEHIKDLAAGRTRKEMSEGKTLNGRTTKNVSRQAIYNRHHRVIDIIKKEIKNDTQKLKELRAILNSEDEN